MTQALIFNHFPGIKLKEKLCSNDKQFKSSNSSKMCIIYFRLAKVAINKGMEVPIEDGFEIEKQCVSQLLETQDRIEGLAAFTAKRVPIYRGL